MNYKSVLPDVKSPPVCRTHCMQQITTEVMQLPATHITYSQLPVLSHNS